MQKAQLSLKTKQLSCALFKEVWDSGVSKSTPANTLQTNLNNNNNNLIIYTMKTSNTAKTLLNQANKSIDEIILIELNNNRQQVQDKLSNEFANPASNPFGGELSIMSGNLKVQLDEAMRRKYLYDKMELELELQIIGKKITLSEIKIYLDKAIPLFQEVIGKYQKLEEELKQLVEDYQDIQFNVGLSKPTLQLPFAGIYSLADLDQQIQDLNQTIEIWGQSKQEWRVKSKQTQAFINQVNEILSEN